jgi:cyanophycinase
MGLEHYAAIGVPAEVVPLRTRADAESEAAVAAISGAAMVFFSGGNPRYLADTVAGTRFWNALLERHNAGAVYAGCSAGAMVASRSPEARPRFGASWAAGLGLVRGGSFGVHWDRARHIPGLRAFVTNKAGGGWFAGIDERTAVLGDGTSWRVFGLGGVTFRLDGTSRRVRAGETFSTPA